MEEITQKPNIKMLDQVLHRTTIEQAKVIVRLQRQLERLQKACDSALEMICAGAEQWMRDECEIQLRKAIKGDNDETDKERCSKIVYP
jgi:hypothetical protein